LSGQAAVIDVIGGPGDPLLQKHALASELATGTLSIRDNRLS
jgi:hypothetical protein